MYGRKEKYNSDMMVLLYVEYMMKKKMMANVEIGLFLQSCEASRKEKLGLKEKDNEV